MAGTTRSTRDAAAAAALIKRGFPHGRRQSKPYPNSGGLTMTFEAGSAAYRRLVQKGRKAA